MKNKKAQIPEAVLILVAIALCATALYYIYAFGVKQAEFVDIVGAVNMRYDEKQTGIYIEDYSKMMLQSAYADVIKSQKLCQSKLGGTIDIWDDCMPNDQEIKNSIKDKVSEKISILKIPFTAQSTDKLLINFNIPFNTSGKTSLIEYNMTHNLQKSLILDYPKIDMEEVYGEVMLEKASCDSQFAKDEDKDNEIQECLSNITLENYDLAVSGSVAYYNFTLSTKEKYFYDNSYKSVLVQFAIKK